MINYTEQEMELVKEAFKVVRLEFPEELKIENQTDVINALLMYKNKYFMNDDKVKMTFKLFERLGLWEDGKTTLKERNDTLFYQKIKYEKRIREINEKRVNKYEDHAKKAQEAITVIHSIPDKLKAQLETESKKIIEQVEKDVEKITRLQETEILRFVNNYTSKMEEEKTKIVKKAQETLSRIKRNKLLEIQDEVEQQEQFLTKEFELIQNSKEGATELEFLRNEIAKIENERDRNLELLGNNNIEVKKELSNYTIAQLTEILEKRNVPIPIRARKMELIKLVKESEIKV